MHFIIYQITNLVNGKIYIGKHKTKNLEDGYMGSGTLLKRAIEKYGIENFKKEILFECSSDEELFNKERELVNENFVAREDTYNLKVGGDGGFDYINKNGFGRTHERSINGGNNLAYRLKTDKEFRESYAKSCSRRMKKLFSEHPEKFANFKYDWTGKHHIEETKKKISLKNKKLFLGERNPQFGTIVMHNDSIRKTLHVKQVDVQQMIDSGWEIGGVYNWELHSHKNEIKQAKELKRQKDFNEKKVLYTEIYRIYCEFGFDAVKEQFDYKFSQVNFVNQCKKYVDDFKPQMGKKRG